ncbi:MAG: hemerythrin domain-containing protein [Jatrophihabitans sp.]
MIDNAHADRRVLTGDVNFSMMYAAHDAFTRHLERLASAVGQGAATAPGTMVRWELFKKQLHIHHTAEDETLWPQLRAAVSAPEDIAVLDAMELEHAQLDPQLGRVDAAFASGGAAAATIDDLAAGLGAHMRHEENEALPLIETQLGRPGWDVFTRGIRKTQGLRGAAVYLPWLLDGAPQAVQQEVLGMLPPPARVLYRRLWRRKYRRAMS